MPLPARTAAAALVGCAVLAAGCGNSTAPTAGVGVASGPVSSAGSAVPAAATTAAPAQKLEVTAGFYPLEWIASRVGGERVDVRTLAKPGAEPHDLELGPSDLRSLASADLVFYLRGFQPAVDEAVEQAGGDSSFDAATTAGLDLRHAPPEPGDEGEEHAEEPGKQPADPHFWLDPTKAAAVADAVADRLSGLDAAGAGVYRANAAALRRDLETLDGDFRAGTASCASRTLVTSHTAFGYLARRYDFRQTGLAGLSPQDEPSPRKLAELSAYVREHGVRTIYYETLVSPDVARTVAGETGARAAVLDPVEGLSQASSGTDYLQVMRSNLASLRTGQSCS